MKLLRFDEHTKKNHDRNTLPFTSQYTNWEIVQFFTENVFFPLRSVIDQLKVDFARNMSAESNRISSFSFFSRSAFSLPLLFSNVEFQCYDYIGDGHSY